MRLGNLVDPNFQAALRKLMTEQLPLKVAYKLKGIATKVDEELKKYDELRNAALNQFGTKDADGKMIVAENGNVQLEGDNLKAFVAQINELVAVEVEMPSISIADLGDKVSLSGDNLCALGNLLMD